MAQRDDGRGWRRDDEYRGRRDDERNLRYDYGREQDNDRGYRSEGWSGPLNDDERSMRARFGEERAERDLQHPFGKDRDRYDSGGRYGSPWRGEEEHDRGREERERYERERRESYDRSLFDEEFPGRERYDRNERGMQGGSQNEGRGRSERESYGREGRGESYDRHIHGRPSYDPDGRYSDRSNREPYDRGAYSRVDYGPRREEPYRGPSESSYRPLYEGNVLGDENYSGLPHVHPAGDRNRHPEFRQQGEGRRDDRERIEGRERDGRGGYENRYENRLRDYGDREQQGRADDRDGGRGHDPSHTWRLFGEWGRTSYGNSRSQGLGFRRTDEYGDQFWSNSERSRGDHYE